MHAKGMIVLLHAGMHLRLHHNAGKMPCQCNSMAQICQQRGDGTEYGKDVGMTGRSGTQRGAVVALFQVPAREGTKK